MGQAAVRQEARKSVLEAQAEMKAERDKREKRLSGLGEDVVVALRERDAAVLRCELQSGRALRKMLDEGLSMKEALQWCGPEVGRREAGRLIKQAEESLQQGEGEGISTGTSGTEPDGTRGDQGEE
ncbi:hypothetical protein DUHN55_46940 [Helicobacter pylori]